MFALMYEFIERLIVQGKSYLPRICSPNLRPEKWNAPFGIALLLNHVFSVALCKGTSWGRTVNVPWSTYFISFVVLLLWSTYLLCFALLFPLLFPSLLFPLVSGLFCFAFSFAISFFVISFGFRKVWKRKRSSLLYKVKNPKFRIWFGNWKIRTDLWKCWISTLQNSYVFIVPTLIYWVVSF